MAVMAFKRMDGSICYTQATVTIFVGFTIKHNHKYRQNRSKYKPTFYILPLFSHCIEVVEAITIGRGALMSNYIIFTRRHPNAQAC